MPFSKTLKSSFRRLETKRPWRSRTLTGTETSEVLTRMTSHSPTSSGPGSGPAVAGAFTGEPIGVIPCKLGRVGCGVVSVSLREARSVFGLSVPTRRGREADVDVPAGCRTPRFAAADFRDAFCFLFAGTGFSDSVFDFSLAAAGLSDSVFCLLLDRTKLSDSESPSFAASELSESVSCLLMRYAPWGQAPCVM